MGIQPESRKPSFSLQRWLLIIWLRIPLVAIAAGVTVYLLRLKTLKP